MLDIYKGIKRQDSKDIFYWLDDYCKDQRPMILENDLVLQSKVKKYHNKKNLKAILFTLLVWGGVILAFKILTKG